MRAKQIAAHRCTLISLLGTALIVGCDTLSSQDSTAEPPVECGGCSSEPGPCWCGDPPIVGTGGAPPECGGCSLDPGPCSCGPFPIISPIDAGHDGAAATPGTGGGPSTIDAGHDGAAAIPGTDGGPSTIDAGPDGSAVQCGNAVDGAPCTDEGASCGGPCTDACSFCNIVTCQLGTWRQMEVFPAPCFDCGPTLRCMSQSTYCDISHSDGGGEPNVYTCMPMPSACNADPTCACVLGQVGSGACTEDQSGSPEITVEH